MRLYRADIDPQRKVALLLCAANGLSRTDSAISLGITRNIVDKHCRRDPELRKAFCPYRAPSGVPKQQRKPLTKEQYRDKWLSEFWQRIDVRGEDECWPWQAAVNKNGYPKIYVSVRARAWLEWPQKFSYPYRVAYQLRHGSIDHSLTIDHLCHNPLCCNPAHLRQCTMRENAANKWFKRVAERPPHLKPISECKYVHRSQIHDKALSPEREQGDSPSRPANDKQSAEASSEARIVPARRSA